jgi:anti-sigma regulatory factor (Ser/Thr protein kinase)
MAATRAGVASAAADHLGDHRFDDVALAVSELITNALEHGHGEVTILHGPNDAASYEVAVASMSLLTPRRSPQPVPPDQVTGRGLNIVAALADDLTTDTVDGVVTVTCRFSQD